MVITTQQNHARVCTDMDQIARLMAMLAPVEGANATNLPGTRIFKFSEYRGRTSFLYDKGVILVGQGTKRIYLGSTIYEYNPDNYLVLSVPIPAECEIFADVDKPVLALAVDIDVGILNRIISLMDKHIDHALLKQEEKQKGLYLEPTTPEIKDTFLRLLTALQSPLESRVLGQGLVNELLFRIMCGENGASLYALTMQNTNLAKIEKALKYIHSSYNETMTVDSLATLVNMSSSAFHRAFNDVTASSPIQYIKKIRLSKASEMLLEERVRVSEAAIQVGYESTAQFTREFKRYFGSRPSDYKKHQGGRSFPVT
jgi:AraC-like DNA-binding protein